MDEGLAEGVTRVDAPDATHIQYKDGEHSLKPENCEIPEPKEASVQRDASSPDSSFNVIAEILDGKNVNFVDRKESLPCSSSRNVDNVGDAVEELTVRNCDGANVAVVGTSSNRERPENRQNQSQHLFSVGYGTPSSSSLTKREISGATPNIWQDAGKVSLPESSNKAIRLDHGKANEHSTNVEMNSVASKMLPHAGIKTKIFSQSGFSQFFVKPTLKGKGIIFKGPQHERYKGASLEHQSTSTSGRLVDPSNALVKVSVDPVVAHDVSPCSPSQTSKPSSCADISSMHRESGSDGLSLRVWLKSESHKVNKAECLYIFRQIIDLVDYSHAQGVFLCDFRPSFFKMQKENGIKYVGSCFRTESYDNSVNRHTLSHMDNPFVRGRPIGLGLASNPNLSVKRQKLNDNASFGQWPLFRRSGIKIRTENDEGINIIGTQKFHGGSSQSCSSAAFRPYTSTDERLEDKWYASPEELSRGVSSMSSNIYSLGILLFELLSRFDSERAREAAMSDIHHRILPPKFLSENPKEAGFCLWLLHPEPSCRPTTRDIVQSELINGIPEMYAEGLSLSIEQEDTESDLLLHFLVLSQEQKQQHAARLMEEIGCLEADRKEIERRRSAMRSLFSGDASSSHSASNSPETRLISNIHQLESAYFSARINAHLPETRCMVRPDRDLLSNNENSISALENMEPKNPNDRVGAFFDGLCKYARHSKFEMKGFLRTGEFNNSANVICSLGFDRDEDFFASAGVSKKIKIFEFSSLFNGSVDIHYPAVEMPNRSRLSCVCWNNYIRNYLASSDYDGIIKLWDVTTGQAILHFIEHEKRAWSVDFSQTYPTKLVSGSDDCSVKLWNINERNCLGTVRNIANVCSVQFSPHSTHLLAFGSADYRTYCYDLRNLRGPWCILSGHDKAVSHVRFLDHETLVTASTDNTLKLWDLKKTTHGGLSINACGLTYGGHANEKNFVGLSTADGYIACGSETNEVYAYHRSLPMPITSYKFGSIDPISGRDIDEDNGLFVSSVCWRRKSNMVVAANSSGCIKVLQLV